MKWFCVLLLPFMSLACSPKSGQSIPEEPAMPSAIALSDITSGNCLNLEKLSRVFQNPLFSLPAAIMTTDLKPIGAMPTSKLNYFSYATFNYKTAKANELGLFTQVRQNDCKTVQMLTASEEILTYQVTASSDKEISIKLIDKFRDTMNAAEKKAMFERQQPFEYTYKYIDANHLVISEKYTTVDILCASKELLAFAIRKDLFWAGRPSDLPTAYEIDATYLNQVKESLMPEVQSQISVIEIAESFSVEAIRTVMSAPLKAELKLCVY